MRRVEVRRVSNGAVVVYESDNHPRTESVYTAIDLALEAASAWLSGEREFAPGQGSPEEVRHRFVSALIDGKAAANYAGQERRIRYVSNEKDGKTEDILWDLPDGQRRYSVIGTPFDPPETPATAWERDE